MQVSYKTAKTLIARTIQAKLVTMLEGSPGIGKSGIVHQIAKDYALKVIDLRLSQCDPTDLLGFPQVEENRSKYVPMESFPIEGDEIPEGYNGWLLFLDEFTSAPRAVQAAAYKLVLDRMVGLHKLHKNVAIVCAGNKATDGAIVEELSTALQSRLVHMELVVSADEWTDWANDEGLDYRIPSYIKFKPDALYTFKPDHTDKTYACPRTWEFIDRFLKQEHEITTEDMPLYAGTLSEGVAREFRTFTQIFKDLPTIATITESPESVPVPVEPSIRYALTGMLSNHMNQDNSTRLMKFVDRLPIEFQVVTLRGVVRRKKDLLSNPAIQGWISKNAAELF